MCGTLEVDVQGLEQVPAQGEITIPQIGTAPCHGQCLRIGDILQVALLQLVIRTTKVCIEGYVLWRKGNVLVLDYLRPLALGLPFLEWFPILPIGRPSISHRCLPSLAILVYGGFATVFTLGLRVREGKVGRVIRHRVLLADYVHLGSADGEILVHIAGRSKRNDRILLRLSLSGIKSIREQHVGIQGIILGLYDVLVVTIIYRYRYLGFLGEQTSQVGTRSNLILIVVLVASFRHALLYATKTSGHHLALCRDRTDVGQLYVEVTLSRPTTFVGKLLQTQFIHPHLHTTVGTGMVANTNHNGFHLAQRRITYHSYAVAGLIGVITGIQLIIGDAILVAQSLQVNQHIQVKVEHISIWPYGYSIVIGIVAILACRLDWSQFQGYLVFIVVIAIIRTQAQEYRHLTALQGSGIGVALLQLVGMSKELQVAVLAHIVLDTLIHGTCIIRPKVLYGQGQCLLVALHERTTTSIGHTRDAWRYYIVDGHTVVVLLNVYGRDGKVSIGTGGYVASIERILIRTPIAMHQVQSTEAQDALVCKVGHKHTHEADVGEVANATHAFTVGVVQWYAYQVPVDVLYRTIAQSHRSRTYIGYILATGAQILWSDGQMVLPVLLALAQGIIGIYILYIGSVLPCCLVAFGRVLTIGRVALWHIDTLVSIQYRYLLTIIIRATEVMIIIVGRVFKQRYAHGVGQVGQGTGVQFVPECLICSEGLFLLIAQSVQAQVLLGSRTTLIIERIGDTIGLGHIAPGGFLDVIHITIDGQTALVCLLTVLQDVFAYLTQIEVQVTAQFLLVRTISLFIEEGVHQPEFDVLYVLCLKVGIVHLAHHTAPSGFGLLQITLGIHIEAQIVWSSLLGIEGHIEHVQCGIAIVRGLRLIGIQFQFVDGTHIVVGQLVLVALDMTWGQCRTAIGKYGVHTIPCQ